MTRKTKAELEGENTSLKRTVRLLRKQLDKADIWATGATIYGLGVTIIIVIMFLT